MMLFRTLADVRLKQKWPAKVDKNGLQIWKTLYWIIYSQEVSDDKQANPCQAMQFDWLGNHADHL